MRTLFLLAVVAALAGCNGGGPVPADPSWSADVQPILNSNCVGCHTATSPSGNYSLADRAGALGTGTDSVPNVIPGRSDSSRLYLRITTEAPLMPLGGTPLDTVKTGTIRNWIDRGARDN